MMSITIQLEEHPNVRLTEQIIDTESPDRLAFAAQGTITITEDLLSQFEGMILEPTQIEIVVKESRTVAIDLEAASLRLNTVDVGVETPDMDDLSRGMDALDASSEKPESDRNSPGAIAFTVDGAISDMPEETLESITEGAPRFSSISFAVEDSVRADGGSGVDVLLEFTLLGYRIVIQQNGCIEIGKGGGTTDINLP